MSDVRYPEPSLDRLRNAVTSLAPSAIVGVMVLDLRHALATIDRLQPPEPELPLKPGADDARWTERCPCGKTATEECLATGRLFCAEHADARWL